MNEYEQAVRKFQAQYMMKELVDCDGNVCDVARKTGVHRNTISRILARGGLSVKSVRETIRVRRKQNRAHLKNQVEIWPESTRQ